jgi:2-methylisocitrate lyase-like PEP mutase family enzyme
MINARTDLYLRNIGDPAARFEEAVERGKTYPVAGADCFYPIALRDTGTMAGGWCRRWPYRSTLNVPAGSLGAAELEEMGVARARSG